MKKYIILFIFLISSCASYSQVLLPADKFVLDSIRSANKGNVILFNFWATWCKPCTEEFPDLLKLNKNFKDKNFKLIFVSLDFGDELGDKTKAFLKKQGVDFVTYFNNFSKDEELINYMSKDWDGSIPGTFIFDQNNILRKTLIGKHNYKKFKEVITKHLIN
ncbi:MAG: TlpA family protein disulfide reductase [Ignavibacteria bacterium]|nr:TlpA family protein disulfide reductase [Ignavibacteria bacterium]